MSTATNVLFLLSSSDRPLYQADFSGPHRPKDAAVSPTAEFICHAALDLVDEAVWKSSGMFFKHVDRFNEYSVSAFVTAGGMKMLLLHDTKLDDSAKQFFYDVYELYAKVLLNPFCDPEAPIESQSFDQRVKQLGRRYF